MIMNELAIGVDIGGTKIHLAAVTRQGEIVREEIVPTPVKQGSEAIMSCVLEGIGRIVPAAFASSAPEAERIAGIGIGSAGQIRFEKGTVEHAVDTIPGWTGTPIKRLVEERFAFPVYVDNDVNVIALAEKYGGAGLHFEHFVCLALGTGVGGAIVESGRIVRGAFGGAGEFGHISVDFNGPRCSCGNYGCLELYASGTGIARVAEQVYDRRGAATGRAKPTSREVIAAWERGEHAAGEAMDIVVRALGSGIASIIHAFNPQAVIIGGGVAEAGDRLLAAVRRETGLRTAPAMWRSVQLLPAAVGVHSGVLGAAAQVWHYEQQS